MNGKNRLGTMAMVMLLAVAGARDVAAQWSAGTFGVAEYDTKQTFLALAGVSASPKGQGVKPLIGLQAYYLTYDAGSTRKNSFTVRPSVGLTNNYGQGDVYATVGYAFASNNDEGPVVASDRGDGTVVSAGWDHWGVGVGAPLAYQVLGSYNFGSESFWTRGRATVPMSQSGSSSTRFGGEVAYLSGRGYSAWQPGAVLEFHMPQGQILSLGAGAKLINNGGNAAYFKVEGYLPLGR